MFEGIWCYLCKENQDEIPLLLEKDRNLILSIIKEDNSDFRWEDHKNSDFRWEQHKPDLKRTREEKLRRYREKRKTRNFENRYRYKLLKLNADRRKRGANGRFV